ncbi:MAG: HigA family addiction module antitoxin [Syntrophobacteraceae bacterium]
MERLKAVHPGEILREDFMKPMGITAYKLAKDLDVPRNRITAILGGRRAVTSDTALRLARYFGTSAKVWMNLQVAHDLDVDEDRLGAHIAATVQPSKMASPGYRVHP